MPAHVRVAPGLQRDFSLHHTLSLYLVETLPKLDPDRRDLRARRAHAGRVDPREPADVVLYAQLDKLKGEKMAELKAQGMEYDERMAELEKLEYPKPNREFIYGTFNAFAEKHPWVGAGEHPPQVGRPRDVRALRCLQRVRARVRPAAQRGRAAALPVRRLQDAGRRPCPRRCAPRSVEDVIAYLRATLARRRLEPARRVGADAQPGRRGRRRPPAAEAAAPRKPRDLAADPKAFAARVRNELHRLLKALAAKDYEEARGACLRRAGRVDRRRARGRRWRPTSPSTPRIDLTPRGAAAAQHRSSPPRAARRWTPSSASSTPTGEADWMLDCVVDLSEPQATPELPLIELRRIGT